MERPDSGTVRDLVRYRIETAKEDLHAAEMLGKEAFQKLLGVELSKQKKSVMPAIMMTSI